MSKLAVARALSTAAAAAAALSIGMLAGSASAHAHGLGGHVGGTGTGSGTVTLNKVTTTKVLVHDGRRRFRFIDIGYAAPVSACFYKQTIWGLAKICPEPY